MIKYEEFPMWCKHCDKETIHLFISGGHERDGSNDYQQCFECEWGKYWGESSYSPPGEWNPAAEHKKRNENSSKLIGLIERKEWCKEEVEGVKEGLWEEICDNIIGNRKYVVPKPGKEYAQWHKPPEEVHSPLIIRYYGKIRPQYIRQNRRDIVERLFTLCSKKVGECLTNLNISRISNIEIICKKITGKVEKIEWEFCVTVASTDPIWGKSLYIE